MELCCLSHRYLIISPAFVLSVLRERILLLGKKDYILLRSATMFVVLRFSERG